MGPTTLPSEKATNPNPVAETQNKTNGSMSPATLPSEKTTNLVAVTQNNTSRVTGPTALPSKKTTNPTLVAEMQNRNSKTTGPQPKWTGWPDGKFEQDFAWDEIEDKNNPLIIHWVSVMTGEQHGGDSHADT